MNSVDGAPHADSSRSPSLGLGVVQTEIPLSSDFLTRVLLPYQPRGTAYLRSATMRDQCLSQPSDAGRHLFRFTGDFCIPSSCYIMDTGHFNAVEFLICYNQLAYAAFGHMFASGVFNRGARDRLSRTCRELLAPISGECFFDHQLSKMLILKCATRFRDVIDPKDFQAELTISRIAYHKGGFYTDTRCRFSDAAGGCAEGDVLLVYLYNPMSRAA
jgi:FcoT-like thioesterase domain